MCKSFKQPAAYSNIIFKTTYKMRLFLLSCNIGKGEKSERRTTSYKNCYICEEHLSNII